MLVLDARDPAEFGVSRLPGALRIDPGISVADFIHLHGERVRGKSVLLYCSVGVRSSRLAARIDAAVRRQGGLGAYNLAGGIFSWHNTGRRLVDARGRSDEVHGFDRNWSRYIDFDNLARF